MIRILSWLGVITLLAFIIVNIIPSPMYKLFRREVEQELTIHPPVDKGSFSEEDIAALPEPVKRHFRVCRWIGKPRMTNAAIVISDMQLKMDLEKDFIRVKCFQLNSVEVPTRIAYLSSSMCGIIPFSGRDKYQDGIGHMYIKVMNLIPIVDLIGEEMNKAALVTVLAETFLAPAYALQPYLCWRSVDQHTAIGTLSYNNTKVSGTFHFRDNGEMERFETNDRYLSQKDGTLKQTRWVTTTSNYQERNGVRIPGEMCAYWDVAGSLKQYARMKISDVRYDVHKVEDVLRKN
jgi:hypothetical protein